MNANDYLEIEEKHAEQIFNEWVEHIQKNGDLDDVPEEFKTKWVEQHLEGKE